MEAYRANAKIMRLLVVMTLNVAKMRHTSGSLGFNCQILLEKEACNDMMKNED